MKFDVLTLFPEMFKSLEESIIGKAKEKNLIDINLINIRDFSKDKHKKVDDTPYGGEGQSYVVLRRGKRADWTDVTDGSAVSLSPWKTDNDCNEPV